MVHSVARWRDALLLGIEVSAEPSDLVIDIDDRLETATAKATYALPGLSVTIDFAVLCSDVLKIADHVFKASFGHIVTPIDEAVDEYVSNTLKWVDGIAALTLSDYYVELVLHAVSVAAESLAEEIAKRAGRQLTQSERKGLRDFARESAMHLVNSRIPNVGPGGTNRSADSPAPVALVEFSAMTQRVYPFWRDVKQRSVFEDTPWLADAKKLPEYLRFTADECRHANSVLKLLQGRKRINGANPAPKVLAREHARLVTGLPGASDAKLKKLTQQGKVLAPKVAPLRSRRKR